MEDFSDHKCFLNEYLGPDNHWGYLIYRTVYTPESDDKWDSVLAKIDTYIRGDLYTKAEASEQRKELSETILSRYRNIVLQDPKAFNNASANTLREHFLQRLADNGKRLGSWGPDNRMFILVDEETLNNIVAAPDDPHEAPPSEEEWRRYRVKVVDATFNPNPPPRVPGIGPPLRRVESVVNRPGRYQGWLYVSFYKLWFLYHRVFEQADIGGAVAEAQVELDGETWLG